MSKHKSPDAPLMDTGPLTLEIADKWLNWLEDVATLESDIGFASRILLLNLFAELALNGVINGERFIVRLAQSKPLLENETQRIALQLLIDDLAEQLQLSKPAGTDDAQKH